MLFGLSSASADRILRNNILDYSTAYFSIDNFAVVSLAVSLLYLPYQIKPNKYFLCVMVATGHKFVGMQTVVKYNNTEMRHLATVYKYIR